MDTTQTKQDPGLARIARFLTDLSLIGCTAAQAHAVLIAFDNSEGLTLAGAIDLLETVAGAAEEATTGVIIEQAG